MSLDTLNKYARKHVRSDDQLSCIDFITSKQGLNAKPYPSQRFFLKVLNKSELDNVDRDIVVKDMFCKNVLYSFTEVEYWNYLRDEGRVNLSLDDYYNLDTVQVLFAWGRRASKSTIICWQTAYRLYLILQKYNPQEYFKLLDDEDMNITIAATGEKNAAKIFAKFWNVIKSSPYFKRFILEEPSTTNLRIFTQRDLDKLKKNSDMRNKHSNSISVTSVPNTPGVRGEGNFTVIMEEFAHFNNSPNSTRETPLDELIYDALVPSTSVYKTQEGRTFGQVFLISTPWGTTGKFFKEFQFAFSDPVRSGTLAIQCPTWYVNSELSPSLMESFYFKNPNSFRQEYGAEFLESGSNWISDLGVFYLSVDDRLNHENSSPIYDMQCSYFLGADFALSGDGTAITICHYDPNYEETVDSFVPEAHSYNVFPINEENISKRPKGKFIIDYCEARYPENGACLMLDDLVSWVESIYRKWPIHYGIYDQWAGPLIEQAIAQKGIKRFEMVQHNTMINDAQYKLFSELLYSGKLKIPNHPPLIKELLSLKEHYRANNMVKIEASRGGNHHDDRFDSMIRSLYLCYAFVNDKKMFNGMDLHNMFRKNVIYYGNYKYSDSNKSDSQICIKHDREHLNRDPKSKYKNMRRLR